MLSRWRLAKAAATWQRSGAINETTRDHPDVADDRLHTLRVGVIEANAAALAVIAAVPYHHTIATTTDRDPTLVTMNADIGRRETGVDTTATVEVGLMIEIGMIAAHHHSRSREISLEQALSGTCKTH